MEEITQLELLGPVQLSQAGQAVRGLRSRKALAVLAYLIRHPGPITRLHLVDLFWPNQGETQGRRNLRWVLSRLTATLPDCLHTDRHSVQFRPTPRLWIDVLAFADLTKQDHATALQEASALYRGDFLAGLDLSGCPDFETWQVSEQEHWRHQMSQLLERLSQHYLQGREPKLAQDTVRRLLTLEPWREEAHRQMMRLLAWQGHRSAALAQYKTCRQVLALELGLEPAAETQALSEQIRDGNFKPLAKEQTDGLGLVTDSQARKQAPDPAPNLPVQITPLVGREAELAQVATLLDDPAIRLVTILGPGGVGKTRLALEVAVRQVAYYQQGVHFVALAPLSDPDSIVPTIAEAVGYPLQADPRSPRQQLLDYLRQKHLLLVLDNFEHLLAGVDLITAILQSAPDTRLIVTSRERLRLSGEAVFMLGGLSVPEVGQDPTPGTGAIDLFIQRAKLSQSDFVPQADDLNVIAQICQMVQGMPLAIILAAAWIEMLSLEDIVTEINQGLDFLAADWRDLPDRQRSLRTIFDHSWQLLTKREQTLFQQLAIFRGGFTRHTARAVVGAQLRDLAGLVNKSFLSRAAEGRHEIHPLLQQYGVEKLRADSALEAAVRGRHSTYFLAFLYRRDLDLRGPHQIMTLTELEADSENIRLAWHWAIEEQLLDYLNRAIDPLGHFYMRRSRYQDGAAACQLAAAELGGATSEAELRLWAKTLLWQGTFNRLLGNFDRARQTVPQALSLLEQPALVGKDIRSEQAAILLEMGQQAQTPNRDQAIAYCERSLSLYRALDDPWGAAQVMLALGGHYEYSGKAQEARQMYEESLQFYQSLGDQRGMADASLELGYMAMIRWPREDSETLLQQSLSIYQDMDDQLASANALRTLGHGLRVQGRYTEAFKIAEEVMRHSQVLHNRYLVADSNTFLALMNLFLGRYDQARSYGQVSLRLRREVGFPSGISASLWVMGQVALAQEDFKLAEKQLRESVTIHRQTGEKRRLVDVLISFGYAVLALGKVTQAQVCLAEALSLINESRATMQCIQAIALAARLALEQNERTQAIELYFLVTRYPVIANSQWHADMVGQYIVAASRALPPKVITAAQERGAARDLWATAEDVLVQLEASGHKP